MKTIKNRMCLALLLTANFCVSQEKAITETIPAPQKVDVKAFSEFADLGFSMAFKIIRMLKDSDLVCVANLKISDNQLKPKGDWLNDFAYLQTYELKNVDTIYSKTDDSKDIELIVDTDTDYFKFNIGEEKIDSGRYILFLKMIDKNRLKMVKTKNSVNYYSLTPDQTWQGLISLNPKSNATGSIKVLKSVYRIDPQADLKAFVRTLEILAIMLHEKREELDKIKLSTKREREIYSNIYKVDCFSTTPEGKLLEKYPGTDMKIMRVEIDKPKNTIERTKKHKTRSKN